MLPIVAWFLGAGNFMKSNWKLLVGVAIVAAVIFIGWSWRNEIYTGAYNSFFRQLAEQEVNELKEDLANERAANAALMEQLRLSNIEDREREEEFNRILENISSGEDGEISDSMRRALRELRERRGLE